MIERLDLAAKILSFIVGAILFYEARVFSAVSKVLSVLGFLKRFIFLSRTVTILENRTTGERNTSSATAIALIAFTPAPRPAGTVVGVDDDGHEIVIVEERNEDLPTGFYFAVAVLTIGLLISLGRSLTFWLALPFAQIVRSVAVWSNVDWSWSSIVVPLISVGHLLLGLISFVLIYTLGLASIIKSALLISDIAATRVKPPVFRFILFVLFFGAGVVTLLVVDGDESGYGRTIVS